MWCSFLAHNFTSFPLLLYNEKSRHPHFCECLLSFYRCTGDREACRILYEQTANGVYYSISRLVSRKEDIEDLTQDTYLTAFSNLQQLTQPQAFPKWLHLIAVNKAKNHLKKHKPVLFSSNEEEERELGSIPAVDEDFLPEEYAKNRELRQSLMKAIHALPEKQRTAVYLYYYEDLSLKEISSLLEVGENTIKSRLNAGRATLRTTLKRTGLTSAAFSILAFAIRTDAAEHKLQPSYSSQIWSKVNTTLSAAPAPRPISRSTVPQSEAPAAPAAMAATKTAAKAGFLSTIAGKVTAITLSATLLIGGITGATLAFRSNDSDPVGEDEISSVVIQNSGDESSAIENSVITEESTDLTETPVPTVNHLALDFAGCPLTAIQSVYGECTMELTPDSESPVYLFNTDNLAFVFAYGEESGCNFISGSLSSLIDNCPETLTTKQMLELFPDGHEERFEGDPAPTYCYDYNDCTVVISATAENTYSSSSRFYYNCDSIVLENTPGPFIVNDQLFDILGLSKAEIDSLLGTSGYYDGECQAFLYTYEGCRLTVYMDDVSSGTCIGFHTYLDRVIDMSMMGSVTADQFLEYFGNAYEDPWNGESCFATIYRGAQMQIYNIGDTPGEYIADSPVICCLLGEEIYPDAELKIFSNHNFIVSASITLYSRSASSLVCNLDFSQMQEPYKMAMVQEQTFSSSDGITYTASNVKDSWGNTYNMTLRFENNAVYFTYDMVQIGEMANFAFGEFVAYL